MVVTMTLAGIVSATEQPVYSVNFDSTPHPDGYITVSKDRVPITTDHFTITAWVKPIANTDPRAWPGIVSYRYSYGSDSSVTLALDPTGHPVYVINTASGLQTITATAAIRSDEWHLIAGTYDGRNAKLYVDGVQVGSVAQTGLPKSFNVPVFIGSLQLYGVSSSQYLWKGNIGDVNFYSAALDDAQNADLYTNRPAQYITPQKDPNIPDFSMNFDAVSHPDGYLSIPKEGLPITTDHFTITAWVKPKANTDPNAWPGIISYRYSYGSGSSVTLALDPTGHPVYVTNTAAGLQIITATAAIRSDEWHLIAATYDGQNAKLYVDGAQVGSVAQTGLPKSFNVPVFIGSLQLNGVSSSQYLWKGNIGNVNFYSTAFDDAKNAALFEVGQAPITPIFSTNFDSTPHPDGYLSIPKADLPITTDHFGITAWVKPAVNSDPNAWPGIISYRYSYGSGSSVTLALDPTGHPVYVTNTAAGLQIITATAAIRPDEWHLIAATYDGQNAKLYVDGAQVGSVAQTGLPKSFNVPVFIGSLQLNGVSSSQYLWKGNIGDVKLYNFALSDNFILDQFNNNTPFIDSFVDDINAITTSDKCVNEWYYAKTETEFYGPYHKCDDPPDTIDNDPKMWCATQAAYVSGKKYGTDWVYCKDGNETKCVQDPWLFVNSKGINPGPYPNGSEPGNFPAHCSNPDNDPNGPWCPTKVAYISKYSPIGQAGTTWDYCTPPIALPPPPPPPYTPPSSFNNTDTAWIDQYTDQITATTQVLYEQSPYYYEMVNASGCEKSDIPLWLDPAKDEKPNEAALQTKGKISWTQTPGGLLTNIQSSTDFCQTDINTGKSKLHELYCAKLASNCKPNPKCTAGTACSYPDICIGTPAEFITTCKTGTECINGACVPASGSASWNGCFVSQAPFLDTNGNGTPDACACPEGMYAKDANGDGNSDTCADRSEICGLSDADKAKYGVVVKAKGLEDGGWVLSEYCSSPFELTSIVCSELDKSKGVMSTSKNSCTPGQICLKGSCIDSNTDLCDGTYSNKNPKIKGWVTINGSSQLWDKCGDPCNQFKSDPAAYNTCLQNPGKYADVVENVLCTSPIDSSIQYYPTPCSMTEFCSDGICKPKPISNNGSGGSGGSSGSSGTDSTPPYDPTKPPTDKNGDNPLPDPGDKSTTPDGKLCTVEFNCKEPTDNMHPVVNGIVLMGNPYIYGVSKAELSCGGIPLPDLDIEDKFKDKCKWQDTDLLPLLTQYGCIGKTGPIPSIGPCDWSQAESCDWTAKPGTAQFGICQKNLPKAKLSETPATATTPCEIKGTDSFGHTVDVKDQCIPSQGKKTVKKFKIVDSPAGYQAYYETCANQHHCDGGVCIPDACFVKKDKIDDKNPCTDDSCKEDTGDIFNTPINVDDYNNCTIDTCNSVDGKAVIIHTAIDTPACKLSDLCSKTPTDPQCSTPTVDCSKTPDNPACPQKPKDIDCTDTANQNDPKCVNVLDCTKTPTDPLCKITVDCSKTPDNPACPKKPTGGFSCDNPANQNDPQCKESLNYCYDNDVSNDPNIKGTAVIFPSTPKEKSTSDTCVDFDGKKFTAVLQVACGPNNTFFFEKVACAIETTNGCENGECVPK